MKKIAFILSCAAALTACSQQPAAVTEPVGSFETYEFDSFCLHVYSTNDVMGDASYIIEGGQALVTLEQPLFKENVAEYDAYLAKLGKPVEQRIADYHLGGTADAPLLMAEGMPAFTSEGVYKAMMEGFASAFGDAIVSLPTGKTSEAAFDSELTLAGVTFSFRHGAATDFPGASLLIGGKVYFTHWTPAKAHVSHLQIGSPAAIDAEIAEAEASLASGASLFIGGHGGAAGRDAVEHKIAYLNKMKEVLATEGITRESFVKAMTEAYPGLPGEEGLAQLADVLVAE